MAWRSCTFSKPTSGAGAATTADVARIAIAKDVIVKEGDIVIQVAVVENVKRVYDSWI